MPDKPAMPAFEQAKTRLAEAGATFNPKIYVLAAGLGFLAGALLATSRRKPCPCKDTVPAPNLTDTHGSSALWQAPPAPWPAQAWDPRLTPSEPPPAPAGSVPAATAPPTRPPMPAPRPVVATDTPAMPADPAPPAGAPIADPDLLDAFQRFHAGDNRAYEPYNA